MRVDAEISEVVDPDPWIVASLVVSAAAMVGQFAQLGLQWVDRPKAPFALRPLKMLKEHLKDSTGSTARSVEKIIRILPKLEGLDIDPLGAPFRYGETSMFISKLALNEYKTALSLLIIDVDHLMQMTHAMVGDDPDFAAKVGIELVNSLGSIKDKINRFYSAAPPIGDVLGDCLMILREFERILTRLEDSN